MLLVIVILVLSAVTPQGIWFLMKIFPKMMIKKSLLMEKKMTAIMKFFLDSCSLCTFLMPPASSRRSVTAGWEIYAWIRVLITYR